MQFKSILVSLVASAALAQAIEYATVSLSLAGYQSNDRSTNIFQQYDLCWKELNGYWSHYGQGRLTLEIDTMNAVDCGFCM